MPHDIDQASLHCCGRDLQECYIFRSLGLASGKLPMVDQTGGSQSRKRKAAAHARKAI